MSRFKKQLNKASQYMNEKVLKAERTGKDEEFRALEIKADATTEVVKAMVDKVHGVLQPNPAARVKVAYRAKVGKVSGKQTQQHYPHAEGSLGDVMLKGGSELGDDSHFGLALVSTGSALKELADYRENLDMTVNQNFVDPLNSFINKELKEVSHHRKKLESRRLDYDGKKRKQAKNEKSVTAEELSMAEEKYEESMQLAENAMGAVIDGEVEQICQLQALIEAMAQLHQESLRVMENLQEDLASRYQAAASEPRPERTARAPVSRHDIESQQAASTGLCRALYDFEAENEGEISFNKGDKITLLQRIDDNWLEGEVHGVQGIFPDNFVEIVVPV